MTNRKAAAAPDPEENETSLELSSVLEGIGGEDVIAKLYEVDEYGRNKFIEKIPLDLLRSSDVETSIQRKHPQGGTFHIRIVKAGKFLKGGSRTIHIAADPNFETTAGYADNGLGGSGDRMLTMQMKMMEMAQHSSDKTMQLMMGLLTAVIGSNRGVDPIALATLMKDSGGGGAAPLAMVKELLGIAKELQPGGASEPDPTMALLGQIVPGLLARGSSATAAAAATPAAAHSAGAPQPPQLPPATKVQPPEENPEMVERIAFLKKLKDKAIAGAAVEFWADYIEENQDEAACRWILTVVTAYPWEAVHAGLVQADPELGTEPYKTWFQGLYDALTAVQAGPANEESKTS